MRDWYPTMDQRFLRAFLTPSRTRLLGRLLFPWCLKHRIQLAAIGSPFVVGGDVTPADCLIFAKVCSEEPIGADPSLMDRIRVRKLGSHALHLAACAEAIKAHIGADAWPKYWDAPRTEGGEPRHNGIPWPLGILSNLVRNGLSLEDAMHLPEAQAVWLSTAMAVQAGAKVEVLTTQDEALLDSLSTVEKPKDGPLPTV